MLINRLLAADDAGVMTKIKEFFTELLYGDSETQYENFSFGNQIVTYRIIILAVVSGLIIASAVMMYKRRVRGKMVRELAKQGCVGQDSAKTLSELGLSESKLIKMSLKNGTLGRMLSSAEKDAHNEGMKKSLENTDGKGKKIVVTDYKPNPMTDRYYIPEDKKDEMLALFSEKGSGAGGFVLTVVVCVLIAAILFAAVPWFIELIDSSL